MNLPTKIIQIPLIPCNNRHTFLYNVKKYVFALAIENEALFKAQGLKNEYIHESVQQQEARKNYNKGKLREDKINQRPLFVHSYIKDDIFTLNGYGIKGIDCLDIWLTQLKKHKDLDREKLIITSKEEVISIQKSETNYTYKSNNWIPYRNCQLKNNFFYDVDKKPNQLANFEKRLKKNIETFLKETCGFLHFETNSCWLIIKNIKSLGKQIALNKQEKHFFDIEFECNYHLPNNFSLGQNVAYGNGVFYKK